MLFDPARHEPLRAADWDESIERRAIARTALREDRGANWPAALYMPAGRLPILLMQFCDGASGFVVCLADFLGDAMWLQRARAIAMHANSLKDPSLQPLVFADCVHQIKEGSTSIVGMMLESHINPGNQPIPEDLSQLAYGVSVTDACIGWDTTEELLRRAHAELAPVIAQRRTARS